MAMLYSSSDIGIDLRALSFGRHLYDKHFSNEPTFHHGTGNALLELLHRIEKFARQGNIFVPAYSCAEIFDQFTGGLYQTLEDLDEELEASKRPVGIGRDQRNYSLDPSKLSRISEYHEKLRYYQLSVELIVDAIERQSITRPYAETVSSNSHARHDRLREVRDKFFQNLPTSTTGLGSGGILAADIIYDYRSQAAHSMAKSLQRHIQEAADSVDSRNAFSSWKVQHALYWYSVSSAGISVKADMPGGDIYIAKSLFDGIKSVWLLHEVLQSISPIPLSPLAEHVMLLLEERLLNHLQSYGSALDDPDYHLIFQHADLSISLPILENSLDQTSESSLNLIARNDVDHRLPQILPATPLSSAQKGKRAKPSIRQPSISTTVSGTLDQALHNQPRSPPIKPPKRGSTSTQIHLSGTLLPMMRRETLPPRLPEVNIADDKITYQDTIHKYPYVPGAPVASPMTDELLVSRQEQAIAVKNLEEIQAHDEETEVENKESKEGFQYTIFASQRGTTSSGRYEAVKVRIFHNSIRKRLRIWTSFAGEPPEELILDLSCDELVPLYAWGDNIEDGSELYFRHQGAQHGLRYKFRAKPGRKTELYGFQGALTSSDFEEEYLVRTVSFTGTSVPDAENPKIQFWTEFEDLSVRNQIFKALEDSGQCAVHGRRDKTIPVNVENLISQVPCSKIFIFSSDKIFVVLVTDRLRLKVITECRRLSGRRNPTTKIQLIPNGDRSCSSIRYRTLQPSRGKSAALPLNHNGIRYADQDTSKFEDCRSLSIEFHSANSCEMFQNLFKALLGEWEARCAPFIQFRHMQRERTVTTTTNTTVVD